MANRDELRRWLTSKRDMAQAGADATWSIEASNSYLALAEAYQQVLDKLDELEHGCAATQAYGATGCT